MATSVVRPVSFRLGETCVFGVASDLIAPYKYQWKRNGAYVGGSQWKSYTTPPLTTADINAKWSVVVFGQDGSEESAQVTLTDAPVAAVMVGPGGVTHAEFTGADTAPAKESK